MKPGTSLAGFTLLEVLVALSIMSISLIAVMKSVLMVQDHLLASENRIVAATLGGDQLARIRQTGLENMLRFSGEFESHPAYRWEIEEIPAEQEELLLIRLDVYRADSSEPVLALEELFLKDGD